MLLISLALAAAGFALRVLLDPFMMNRAAFVFFLPAMCVGAGLGGLRVGLPMAVITTAAGLAGEVVCGDLSAGSYIAATSFAAVSLTMSLCGELMVRARAGDAASAADMALREAHLSSILHTVPDAMILLDDKGMIRDFSPTAERQFGWAARDVTGKNISMLLPDSFDQFQGGYLDRFIRGGEPRMIGSGREVFGVRKDGTTFPMELAVGEMHLPKGRYFAGFVRDITERQKTETRLQELQNELVHASRLTALGEMASALAHELNQPLSAIGNYLMGSKVLLRRTEVPLERVADAVERAGEEALRAGEIIRRLRNFVSRGESERRVESLPKLVEEASQLALVEATGLGVRVRFELSAQVDLVLVDKVQVQQVLLNLIRNAVDAMSDSVVRVLVIAAAPAAGGLARISIADTGPGIDPQVRENLFRPFVTTKPTGMGVGLSICRTIIEAHGGEISAGENEFGGATFHFTVPQVAREELIDGQ